MTTVILSMLLVAYLNQTVEVGVEGWQLITAIPDESDTHRVMTALILVLLPSRCSWDFFCQSHRYTCAEISRVNIISFNVLKAMCF
jgi:hypothetical protein